MTLTLFQVSAVAGGLTFVLSLVFPFVVRPLLVRLGIMDVPNARSSHEQPVLRGVGLAVLLAMLAGGGSGVWLLAAANSLDGVPGAGAWQALPLVLGAALFAGLLGLGEDLTGISVGVRSAILIAIALAVGLGLVWYAGAAWWLVIYAVLFVSGYINVANFMDGLNGISGFHGVVAGATFAVVGWAIAAPWLVVAGLVLAAGFAGFLPWNLTKPGAFLGDVGSYLLGGATAATSLFAFVSGAPILATIGPMVIYFGDVAVTLVKRVRAGHKWDEPHKEHAYQRIQQLGYSHVQASAITAGASVATSALGFASIYTNLVGTLALLVAGVAMLVFYLLLPRLLPRRSRG